ncbi:proprotein convertase P-domain-containing protein [Lacinutrix sp. C3R15]|uniref:zinc-dependent metalloprotease family protein n=1 Tax=Flavobacteriaceae TaxID=49546 RepID=UPI001C0804AE|nr:MULTISPECIES: zinc-dependent metalloprotease family protein [Flavobacteriaceae]MBU2939409.1 proprotein convertase P-domain-containing protein [Lacinutrix sp. C3R15]MDO6622724.1 zinc-dependent metalloprotease family protein [Oceanihabitans sp. 1_MG-2023]
MKKIPIIFTVILCAFMSISWAQNKTNDWSKITPKKDLKNISFNKDKMPTAYSLYSVNLESIKNKLQNTPILGEFFGASPNIIQVPNAAGGLESYRVLDTEILHPTLAAQLPNIKSFVGRSIENPGTFIRFSVSQAGFHGQVFEPGKSTFFIDPYTKDKSVYIAYKRSDLVNSSDDIFSCETDNTMYEKASNTPSSEILRATDDSKIRRYELAMSCTGEYGALFIGSATTDFEKKSNIMAQMVITMTRVNGIYEKEMGVTFQFVPNNFDIMYYDAATDPFDGEYNDKTQEVIDNNIGDANYDIGHNFNTDGGGNAGCIGCVCTSGTKGSGMTGRSNPTGDSFDVDYVAHEIGHQMGGYHTHNGTTTCLKSGNNTEVEPGSGSSIMGYAGICTGQNVQDNSDDYFNYVNIRDISANIQSGVSSTCFDEIVVTNLPPTADAGDDYIIPIGTAFVLTASGSDPDTATNGDVITYTWEQNDNEDMQSPLLPIPTATAGPMFRSRRGSTSPKRYLPQMSDILNNDLTPTWEVIPYAQRAFEFALTVRDNVIYGGQTADDLMTINTDMSAGPFEVSSQNENTTWTQGATETITWDVANTTNILTVNCQLINISFSATGDFTDTVILANNVPNNGTANITVPATLTTTGRLMVSAADNIFLDVNDAIITIEEVSTPTFFLTAIDVTKSECNNTNSTSFSFDYIPSSGFLETVTFSATGLPAGATTTFTPVSASTAEETIVMTIDGFNGATAQDYTITAEGTSISTNRTADVNLTLQASTFSVPSLVTPVNYSTNQATYPNYTWSTDNTEATVVYDIEIASDSNFNTIIETSTVASNTYTQTTSLNENTTYYWRVKQKNECGESVFSTAYSFTTGETECLTANSTTPSLILSTLTTSSTITIENDIPLSDINISVDITHPYIGDVVLELISPQGTTISLIATQCDSNPDMLVTFDDAGSSAINCSSTSPAISGTLQPIQALSALNGESSLGDWTLNITDTGIGDDGYLNSWSITYCGVQNGTLGIDTFSESSIKMYPNPATNYVTITSNDGEELAVTLYDLLGRKVLYKELDNTNKSINTYNLSSGTYIVNIQTSNNVRIIKKLIID